MTGNGIERAISDVTDVLLVPVLVLALLCLVLALAEGGRVIVEMGKRRTRGVMRLDSAVAAARTARDRGDRDEARAAVSRVSGSSRMAVTAASLVEASSSTDAEARSAKLLADYDYASLKRLERTRVLVRAGPALGLMGTLIPLSPALQALSRGDVTTLAKDLRVAFSVTVLGLLIGALGFAVSLVRDRLYGQDLSDLEYLSASLQGQPS